MAEFVKHPNELVELPPVWQLGNCIKTYNILMKQQNSVSQDKMFDTLQRSIAQSKRYTGRLMFWGYDTDLMDDGYTRANISIHKDKSFEMKGDTIRHPVSAIAFSDYEVEQFEKLKKDVLGGKLDVFVEDPEKFDIGRIIYPGIGISIWDPDESTWKPDEVDKGVIYRSMMECGYHHLRSLASQFEAWEHKLWTPAIDKGYGIQL